MQKVPAYILGNITILDFFFIESALYMVGFFGSPHRVHSEMLMGWDQERTHILQKPNVYYLKVMRDYLNNMRTEPFYVKNKEYLESFSIRSSFFGPEREQGLKNIWLLDVKFIQ